MNHYSPIKSYTCLVCVRFDLKHKPSPPKAIIRCNGISLHATIQTDLGDIMLSEKQSQEV